MKPGYKTTEFWMAFITTIAGAILTSGMVAEGSNTAKICGTIMSVVASLGYGQQRMALKKADGS